MARGEPKTRKGWMAYVHRHNLQALGFGVSRTAYALDAERVIKIDHEQQYWGHESASRKEAQRWADANDVSRQFLAEVLGSGEGWLVMERAESTLKYAYKARVTSRLRKATDGALSDMHEGNVGYFGNGVYKLIDYAV